MSKFSVGDIVVVSKMLTKDSLCQYFGVFGDDDFWSIDDWKYQKSTIGMRGVVSQVEESYNHGNFYVVSIGEEDYTYCEFSLEAV